MGNPSPKMRPWQPSNSSALIAQACRPLDPSRRTNIRNRWAPIGAVAVEPRFQVNSKIQPASTGLFFGAKGRVAQLVRAPASHAGGHRFESCRAHHTKQSLYRVWRYSLRAANTLRIAVSRASGMLSASFSAASPVCEFFGRAPRQHCARSVELALCKYWPWYSRWHASFGPGCP